SNIYDIAARPIVEAVLNGYNGTVFVYGQTGTGKTFSMQGVTESPELRGIIPNTFHHVFAHIARTPERQYLVRVSYLEIYNEEIRDLLNPHQNKGSMNFTHHSHGLDIKEHPEHGLYVKDLTSVA
ncbi:Kinesin-like protein kif3a, partial [Coelomomyces lativittatus]